MDNQTQSFIEEKLRAENQLKGGASWFYWIAGLSIVNSIMVQVGSQWGFIIGLGITQLIDALGTVVAEQAGIIGKILAIIFDFIAAGIFVTFGIFAHKKRRWAFIVGMVLYAIDGLIFLLIKDFLSMAFHILALYCIYGGLKANKRLAEIEKSQSSTAQRESITTS